MRTPVVFALLLAIAVLPAVKADEPDGPEALAKIPRLTDEQAREAVRLAEVRLARRLAPVDAHLEQVRDRLDRIAVLSKLAGPAPLIRLGSLRELPDAVRWLAVARERAEDAVADFRSALKDLKEDGAPLVILRPSQREITEPLESLVREGFTPAANAVADLHRALERVGAGSAEADESLRRIRRLQKRLADFPPLQFVKLVVRLEQMDEELQRRYEAIASIHPRPLKRVLETGP